MSDLKFSGFAGPARAINSQELIETLGNDAGYRKNSAHSTLLIEAKRAISGLKRYFSEYCRAQPELRNGAVRSPSKSNEIRSQKVSNVL